jgi:hypothetical protein
MFCRKGDLNQVNAQMDRGFRAAESQFNSYMLAACSLVLMVMLVVGTAGYAGVHRLLSSSTSTVRAAHLKQLRQYTMSRNSSSFITCK